MTSLTLPAAPVRDILERAFAEDAPSGDITSQLLIPAEARATAVLNARVPGVFSGGTVFRDAMLLVDPDTEVELLLADGEAFDAGTHLARVSGRARSVLLAERVGLNLAQRMSAIATKTAEFVKLVDGTKARITDTRKTTPGLRVLERYAVRCGGGANHRYSLSDAVLAKDNHLAVMTGGDSAKLTALLKAAKAQLGHTTHFEVEVDRAEQIEPVLAAGVDTIMLDNFSLEELRAGVKQVGGRAVVEASGNVNVNTVADIAAAGVDVISIGGLTHSVNALDLGLDVTLDVASAPSLALADAMIFLDAAATTPVRREVLEAMWPYLTGEFGNPSSHHSLGEAAANALSGARASVAKVLGCRPGEITFTSGGTEADNLAVKGIALARRAADPSLNRIAISAIEHPAVEESARFLQRVHGFEVDVIPVDRDGMVTAGALRAALGPRTALVSVMYANNEIGTVQPVRELAEVAAEHGVPFHTDAVQAAGWLPIGVKELGVDALSISGHKLGAPKGSGVLFAKGRLRLEPLVHGGGQERGRRSGTENVAGAVALATALTLAHAGQAGLAGRVSGLRDTFIRAVQGAVPGAMLTGHPSQRLPSVASFCFPGTSGESVLLELERLGVVCSSGSACAAGSDAPSPVLVALGIEPELAHTAVRFSFDSTVTPAELQQAAEAVAAAVGSVQGLGRR